MPVFSTRCRTFAALSLVSALMTSTASAQSQGDKDLKAISGYTLTMPKYKQMMTAMLNLGKAAQQNPGISAALENSADATLDQMIGRLNAVPQARNAIADAGLSTREFALIEMASLQAGMAYGLTKQLHLTPDSVAKTTGVSKGNLEFFRTNEAELERMRQAMEAQMPKDQSADVDGEAADSADSTDTSN
jgi:hypothetical protein